MAEFIIVTILDQWGRCIKEREYVSRELDKQGFSIRQINEGIIKAVNKDTYYFRFHSIAAYPNCLKGIDFYTTLNSVVSVEDLKKEFTTSLLGMCIIVPSFKLVNEI